jgi:hypothetical protein
MFVMTAKVNKKKIILALAAAAVLIVMLIMVFGGGNEAAPTAAPALSTNDGRVAFLKSFGWEVASSPTQSGQVRIPENSSEVFSRYNALQKSQGYDLSQYAGKTVMRYVYKIKNYPGATDPVFATILLYKDQVIGGDVTDTGAKGVIRGFKMPQNTPQTIPETAPTTPTTPSE